MATSDERSAHANCSVCLEIYKSARTLPCCHSFCETCIQGYINKLLEKRELGRDGTFPCPVCRKDTPPPVERKPPSEWGQHFPLNYALDSVLDVMLRKEAQEKKQDVDPEFCCPLHTNLKIEYFCKTEDILCCNKCAIMNHRSCTIEDIAELAHGVKTSTELKRAKNNSRILSSYLKSRTTDIKQKVNNVKLQAEQMKSVVNKVRDQLNCLLDEFEQRLVPEINRCSETESKRLVEDLSVNETNMDIIKRLTGNLNFAIGSKNESEIFINLKRLEKEVSEVEATIPNQESVVHRELEMSLELDQNLKMLLKSTETLGKLNVKKERLGEIKLPIFEREVKSSLSMPQTRSLQTEQPNEFKSSVRQCECTPRPLKPRTTNEKTEQLSEVNSSSHQRMKSIPKHSSRVKRRRKASKQQPSRIRGHDNVVAFNNLKFTDFDLSEIHIPSCVSQRFSWFWRALGYKEDNSPLDTTVKTMVEVDGMIVALVGDKRLCLFDKLFHFKSDLQVNSPISSLVACKANKMAISIPAERKICYVSITQNDIKVEGFIYKPNPCISLDFVNSFDLNMLNTPSIYGTPRRGQKRIYSDVLACLFETSRCYFVRLFDSDDVECATIQVGKEMLTDSILMRGVKLDIARIRILYLDIEKEKLCILNIPNGGYFHFGNISQPHTPITATCIDIDKDGNVYFIFYIESWSVLKLSKDEKLVQNIEFTDVSRLTSVKVIESDGSKTIVVTGENECNKGVVWFIRNHDNLCSCSLLIGS